MHRISALFLTAAIVALIVPTAARGQDSPSTRLWIFQDNVVTKLSEPSLSEFSLTRFHGRFGLFTSAFVSTEYATAYLGPTVSFGPVVLGMGAGLETDERPSARGAFMTAVLTERFWAIAYAEYGGSGPYARTLGAYTPVAWFGMGLNADGAYGAGPYVEFRPFGEIAPITLNASYLVVDFHEGGVAPIVFGGYLSL